MNIYLVAIKKFSLRYEYIIDHINSLTKNSYKVIGVDGSELDKTKFNNKLSIGQLGCAASHVKACKQIFESSQKCGLIIEDDVILPSNLDEILDELESIIKDDEVIFLYNRNRSRCEYSNFCQSELKHGNKLIYPLEMRNVRTAAGYVIGRTAAEKIYEFNKDLNIVADDWNQLYLNGCISNPRILYPNLIRMKGFVSSIGYSEFDTFVVKISKLIFKGSLFQFIRKTRLSYLFSKLERNHVFVNKLSELVNKSDKIKNDL